MQLITTTEALEDLCQELSDQEFVAVDLEFLREKTYYAKLCLIQLGSAGPSAVVDPLAEEIDLSAFFRLMQNPKVTKVFHSGRQDIEIIYHLSRQIPAPIFDTQIAAMVLGFGDSVSYENLVKQVLSVDLDKSSRLSDWSLRPLQEEQLNYALADVTHLVPVYLELRRRLEQQGRMSWIEEETAALSQPQLYETEPDQAWLKIRQHLHNPVQLTVLRELAAWREQRCQDRDTPRQRMIRDEVLTQIAAACPDNVQQLARIRGFTPEAAKGKLGKEILDVLDVARCLPAASQADPRQNKEVICRDLALYDFLRLLLKICSQQEGVVARLIAADEELKYFCNRRDRHCRFLNGWRRLIFGEKALRLREGNLQLVYNPSGKEIEFCARPAAE